MPRTMSLRPPNLPDFSTHFDRSISTVLRRSYWWPSELTKLNMLSSLICTLDQLSSVHVTRSSTNTSLVTLFATLNWLSRRRDTSLPKISADLSRYSSCCVAAVPHRQSSDHAISSRGFVLRRRPAFSFESWMSWCHYLVLKLSIYSS